MAGFQSTMNMTQAPACEGDIASLNPRYVLPGAEGAWTAGTGGITLGRFVWADKTDTNSVLLNAGTGAPSGIAAREMGAALITTYLSETSVVVPAGFAVPTVLGGGDIWVKNTNSSAAAAVGNKAYASNTTGQVQFAATGQTISGYTETSWTAMTIGAAGALVKINL